MGIIDIHAHALPVGFIEALRSEGHRFGVTIVDRPAGPALSAGSWTGVSARPILEDAEARHAFLDEQGIDVQVLSPWIDLTGYDVPAEHGEAYCSFLNAAMAREVARKPDRYVGLGSVPLQSGGEAAARSLEEAMDEHGLAGVQIGSRVPGMELSDPSLDAFWQVAEARQAVLVMHPHYSSQLRPTAIPVLEFVVANPADTTLAVAQLMFSRVLERHPDLQLCLCHGGGFLPWQIGRMDKHWSMMDRDSRPMEKPSEQLRRLWFDTIVHGPHALDYLKDRVGEDRILVGTDYPFGLGDLTPEKSLAASSLAQPDTHRKVTRGNAETLLARAGFSF